MHKEGVTVKVCGILRVYERGSRIGLKWVRVCIVWERKRKGGRQGATT